jgi:predicted helicase
VGQKSANDNAQNQSYPKLEGKIEETYVKGTKATNKNSLYEVIKSLTAGHLIARS